MNKSFIEKVGCNLKALREDKTQEEIAKLLNVSRTTYTKYELGVTPISIYSLNILADYYNVTTDYILGRED